jgi:hypothetical protein
MAAFSGQIEAGTAYAKTFLKLLKEMFQSPRVVLGITTVLHR